MKLPLAQAHKWLILASRVSIKAQQGMIEQRKQFSHQESDTHGIDFLREKRQVYIFELRVPHAYRWQRKLQAGAGKQAPLCARGQALWQIPVLHGDPVQESRMNQIA